MIASLERLQREKTHAAQAKMETPTRTESPKEDTAAKKRWRAVRKSVCPALKSVPPFWRIPAHRLTEGTEVTDDLVLEKLIGTKLEAFEPAGLELLRSAAAAGQLTHVIRTATELKNAAPDADESQRESHSLRKPVRPIDRPRDY